MRFNLSPRFDARNMALVSALVLSRTGIAPPRWLPPAVLLSIVPQAGFAHGVGLVGPGDLWTHWSLDSSVLAPLLVACWLYRRGESDLRGRLGRSARRLPAWRIAAFVGGVGALVVALLSPLDELSGTLLTAHMVQHALLVTVAPILILFGHPEIACFRGLPARWRRGLARDRNVRRLLSALGAISRPMPAAALHGAMLWLWHVPALFEAAGALPWLHWLEHVCFLATALLFWRGLVAGWSDRASAAVASLASLATLVHSGFLGALLTLGPAVLYPASTRGASLWGMTPLQDQQLAGVIMWAPMGAFYLAAGLALAARTLEPTGGRRGSRPVLDDLRPKPSP